MQPIQERKVHGVAVFDFDGTSIDGQSGRSFTRYPLQEPHHVPAAPGKAYLVGRALQAPPAISPDEARELVFGALAGRSAAEVDAVMARFYDEVLAPLYRPRAVEEAPAATRPGSRSCSSPRPLSP